jgi:hypothetical protein
MKRHFGIIPFLLLFVFILPLHADEVDDSLPVQTSEQLRASTREMIQAGIDKDEAITLTRAMIRNRFSEENIVQAQKIIQQAHQANLPVEPVMNKAHEGMSKNIAEKQILGAMEKTRSRYAYAYEHVRQLSDEKAQIEKTGSLLAKSLSAGLTEEDAGGLMTQLRERTRQLNRQQSNALCEKTLLLTRNMMRLGTSSTDGARMVGNALQKQFSAAEMEKIMNTFMHQSRFQPPDALANQYARQIQNGLNADAIGGSGALSNGDAGTQTGKTHEGPAGAGSTGTGSGSDGSGGSGNSGSGGSEGSGGSGNSGGGGSEGGAGAGGSGKGSGIN